MKTIKRLALVAVIAAAMLGGGAVVTAPAPVAAASIQQPISQPAAPEAYFYSQIRPGSTRCDYMAGWCISQRCVYSSTSGIMWDSCYWYSWNIYNK